MVSRGWTERECWRKKNLSKIFTKQRTRFVTKTFQRDTLRRNKHVSRLFPRKGGNIQDLPSPRKDQLILLKINTDGARRHLPQLAVIQTSGVVCYL